MSDGLWHMSVPSLQRDCILKAGQLFQLASCMGHCMGYHLQHGLQVIRSALMVLALHERSQSGIKFKPARRHPSYNLVTCYSSSYTSTTTENKCVSVYANIPT